MSHHYSTKSFFRRIPNPLLARYFQTKGLFLDLNIANMQGTKIDTLFEAWLQLPEVQRNDMDAIFRIIWVMSCQKGFIAIRDEAQWQWRDEPERLALFIEQMSGMPSHYHRAMTTFLDHNDFWLGATRFYHADTLSYWRKRKNMGHQTASVDRVSLKNFEFMLQHYFHHTEGRGENCVVEVFRRGGLDYFFAYPEDHAQQSLEWIDGEFENRPHNPAFEVVFVYSQEQGTLDVNFSGDYRVTHALQSMFAVSILKLAELPPDPEDTRIYNLEPLKNRRFKFVYDAYSGIEKVRPKKMRLTSKLSKRDRITVEADDADTLYDTLEKISQSVPLHLYKIDRVELLAEVVIDPNKPAKKMTIRITQPCSCSLKYEEYDLKLREMLRESGIEPVELDSMEK